MEINEITQLVKEHQLPVIFTEVNGSDATANAISRETGCQVAQLTMLMDGPEGGPVHLSGRRAEQREHHRILLRGRGVGSAVRKIKHGRLAGGCSDACCLKLEGLSVHIQGRTSWRMCPSTSTAGDRRPHRPPTGRASPPCSAASWGRCHTPAPSPSPLPAGLPSGCPTGQRSPRRPGTRPSSAMCPSPQL